ncbi:replication endonuclease [Buttiauxella sp. 3AFRM03]|uniref:replication endonuclease n=1 Tax=Buttiauxella sp. 3AFRM03 TaxID=2479367 RepID=UPI000EF8253A|nr:replication endonuclease [Buttiauxella sp. 3AFRM03]AYN26556.1 replication endonuclease [Buttiauxella sp. 3AFRM03]
MIAESRGRKTPTPPPAFPGCTDNTQYAYAWNQPRAAVNPAASEEPRFIEYLTPYGYRKKLTIAELSETPEPPDQCRALRRRLASLPQYIRRYYAQRLYDLDQQSQSVGDAWLLKTFERHVLRRIDDVNEQYAPQATPLALQPLHGQFYRLLWAGKRELKRLAYNLADLMIGEFEREYAFYLDNTGDLEMAVISGYGRIGYLASHLNMGVPCWTAYCNEELDAETALCAVSRMETPRWWLNKLRQIHARWREHLMIAAGYVHKKSAPYCSNPCAHEWLAQKKANREYLKAMELEDQKTGERHSLIDKVARSVANPSIRRAELMARMRGFEDLAKLDNLAGDFYTLTAPSKYHSMQQDGRRNDKYGGASPRLTQKYLCKVWSRTRAAWKRAGIRVFGFRVTEPHHDATPHWHLLLFMRPEHIGEARQIFRKYALEEDGHEAGAQENRFKAKPIEEERGGATGYIAKYISKNIDGYALDGETDDETGEPLRDMSKRVNAWASRWKIRQFQQIGGAPVTVYRELRRIKTNKVEIIDGDGKVTVIDREYKDPIHTALIQAQQAADDRKWPEYTIAQGGPLVERRHLRVRLSYETKENGNDYGDTVAKINGIYCPIAGAESLTLTRTTEYKIVPKRAAVGVDLDFQGGIAAPRSTVNNCTPDPAEGEKNRDRHDAEDDENTAPIDFERLTRKEKREIASRLAASVAKRRRQVKPETPPAAPLDNKQHIKDTLLARGVDASDAAVASMLAGATIACGERLFGYPDGRLVERKTRQAIDSTVSDLIARLKKVREGVCDE